MPWHEPPSEPILVLQELFHNSNQIVELEIELSDSITSRHFNEQDIENQIANLKINQSYIRPQGEEFLEGLISSILKQEGFQSRVGLIWPPVDVSLSTPPKALVISPRDVIERQTTVTLRPNMTSAEIESLEQEIQLNQNLSALVVEI